MVTERLFAYPLESERDRGGFREHPPVPRRIESDRLRELSFGLLQKPQGSATTHSREVGNEEIDQNKS